MRIRDAEILTGAPETDIVVAGLEFAREIPASLGCSEFVGRGILSAAASPACRPMRRILAAVRCVVGVRAIGAADPFPSVAGHIEYAIRAGAVRKTCDHRGFSPAASILSAAAVGRLITPWVFPAVCSARRFFPLRFSWQTLSQPPAVLASAYPRWLHNGVIFKTGFHNPLSVSKMDAGVRVIFLIVAVASRALWSEAFQKGRKLSISHLISIDRESWKHHGVCRPLIGRSAIAAHCEWPGRDRYHIRGLCLGEGDASKCQRDNAQAHQVSHTNFTIPFSLDPETVLNCVFALKNLFLYIVVFLLSAMLDISFQLRNTLLPLKGFGQGREVQTMSKVRAVFLLGLAVLVSVPIFAHHNAATVYDVRKESEIKIEGVVTKMEWMNPHIHFYVDVKDKSGKVVNYAVEGGTPNGLYRNGWRKDDLKPGTKVKIEGAAPSRDGSARVHLGAVLLENGKRLFSGRN
jgi:hypothetical protein